MTVPMPLPAQLLQDPARRRADEREWRLAFSAAERGRRLAAFKKATAGKQLIEVRPGLWEYVAVPGRV